MKKGMSMSVTLTLIVLSLLLVIVLINLEPLKSGLSSFSNMGACKTEAFYYDVISHNPDYSLDYYNEYIDCNLQEKEDAYVYAWREIGLDQYGAMNLIFSYINKGYYDRIKDTMMEDMRSYYGESFSENVDLTNEIIDDFNGWNIFVRANWGEGLETRQISEDEMLTIFGSRLHYTFVDDEEVDDIEDIMWVELEIRNDNEWIYERLNDIYEGSSLVLKDRYVLVYEGYRGATIFWTFKLKNFIYD
jgi:hypothetical protein